MSALESLTEALLENFDKVAHFVIGVAVSQAALFVGAYFSVAVALYSALLAPVFVMAIKEVWDYHNPPHVASALDMVAGALGSAPVVVSFYLGRVL